MAPRDAFFGGSGDGEPRWAVAWRADTPVTAEVAVDVLAEAGIEAWVWAGARFNIATQTAVESADVLVRREQVPTAVAILESHPLVPGHPPAAVEGWLPAPTERLRRASPWMRAACYLLLIALLLPIVLFGAQTLLYR